MSKDYLCKNCVRNNNGWCLIKKMNGLSKITECTDKNIKEEIKPKEYEDEIDYTPYKNYGKREMFYNIQRQLEAMDNEETVKTVKQIMVNLEKMLQIEERVQGIETEYEIEQDIINGSKYISNKWLNEVGEYKGK